jgi:hypothetical protein
MAEYNLPQPVDPSTVYSPRDAVSDVHVVYDGGAQGDGSNPWAGWSVARLKWYGVPAVGCRWNGGGVHGVGNPAPRGYPAWFIIPGPLGDPLVQAVLHLPGGPGTASEYRMDKLVREFLTVVREAKSEELVRLMRPRV